MNRTGKAEALKKWAQSWPHLDEYLKLNAILTDDGDASMNPIGRDVEGTPFIDGTASRDYYFMLKLVLPWSDGYDSVNTDAQTLMESWMDWVDAQYPNNIPEWDGDIETIEAVADEPEIMTYQEESLATYNFICKITYTE